MKAESEKLSRRGSKHASPELRSQQIINAALQCFCKNGFTNTTIDKIAQVASLSKGSVYRFFASKEELLLAVIDYLNSVYMQRFKQQSEGKSALEKIEIFFQVSLDDIMDEREMTAVWLQTLNLDFARERLKQIFIQDIAVITELVQQGIDDGEFRDDAIEAAPTAIVALLNGHFLLSYLMGDSEERSQDHFEKSWHVIKQQLLKE